MGLQDNFTTNESSVHTASGVNRTAKTVNYITDLLGELSAITNISGLNALSADIDILLSKHVVGSD